MTAGTADLVHQFEREATDAGCEVRRTPADGFDETLADCLEFPAVGAPLTIEGVSLPESVVTDPSPQNLEAAKTGVTAARFGVADYGSVAVESTRAGEEAASLWPEHHVAILAAGNLVADMKTGIERVGKIVRDSEARCASNASGERSDPRAGGDVVLATGPSATADMGELVVGAHGPRAVSVVVLEDR